MNEATVIVRSKVGLHARPAAAFVQEALKYQATIVIEANNREANGKSILQVLALGIECGQEITIKAEGKDEEQAVTMLVRFIQITSA